MVRIEKETLSWDRQREFARVSGDYNPVHMDDAAARRTQAGRALVHGMHLALWALDRLAARETVQPAIAGFKAKFSKMVFVGETISLRMVRETGSLISAQVLTGTVVAASVTVTRGQFAAGSGEAASCAVPEDNHVARDLSLDAMAGLHGTVRFANDAECMFPSMARVLGTTRVRAIGAISKLVGMTCPGLHSMAYSYDVAFVEGGERDSALQFRVTDVEDRFRLLTETVSGGGLRGTVVAVARMPPVAQSRISALAKLLNPNEFAGVRALVIGGSRGLGELAAKMVAAGGGSATVTYAVGKLEAEAVCEEVRAWGGNCRAAKYDVRDPAAEQIEAMEWRPSHLFYFATGVIASRYEGVFSPRLFEEFCRFYVTGFYELCQALLTKDNAGLAVLYPSSVFVTDRPAGMTEYAMAKAAGEVLCAELNRAAPKIRIDAPRLPRMLTDQTATATPLETEDATEVLLPLIRKLCGSAAGELKLYDN